jgi:lipoate-protein ligase A
MFMMSWSCVTARQILMALKSLDPSTREIYQPVFSAFSTQYAASIEDMFALVSHARSLTRQKSGRFLSSLTTIRETKAQGQLFRLTSDDPYLNLSIEHYIFQNVPLSTKVLLFYINRPCIVIGRNQNPWVEINLRRLKAESKETSAKSQILGDVDFVRRRSGGGTVFHDSGNVNWGVICDANEFTRDKHAEMVVRGIQEAGVPNVRVNERHDIVLESATKPLKVSGSAYKLARGRALHHGTALCQSKNLGIIPEYLRSPAKPFITARGVDSVRSPITNLDLDPAKFIQGVESEFRNMYDVPRKDNPVTELGSECLDIKEIQDGYEELKVC